MADFNYLFYFLVGTSALFVLFGLLYVAYLILDNDEKEFNTRSLGISILFLILASFFSGINFVHYFIEKKPFLQFLYEYSAQIGIAFWFALAMSIFYFLLEKRFLKTAKEEINEELEKIRKERGYLQEEKNKQLEKVKKEVEKIIAEAYQEKEKIIKQAELEREKLIEEAKKEIQAEKERILNRFKEETPNKTTTRKINKKTKKTKKENNEDEEIDLSF